MSARTKTPTAKTNLWNICTRSLFTIFCLASFLLIRNFPRKVNGFELSSFEYQQTNQPTEGLAWPIKHFWQPATYFVAREKATVAFKFSRQKVFRARHLSTGKLYRRCSCFKAALTILFPLFCKKPKLSKLSQIWPKFFFNQTKTCRTASPKFYAPVINYWFLWFVTKENW